MLGEPLAPVRPHLAAAQRAGEVSPEQVAIIERALARVDRPGFDPADIDAGEQLLTRFAHPVRTQRPEDAGRSGGRPHRPRRQPTRRGAEPRPPVLPPARQPKTAPRPGSSGSPASAGDQTAGAARPAGQTAAHHRRRTGRRSRSSARSAAPRPADARRPRRRLRPAAARRQHDPRRRRHPGHGDHHHRHRRPAGQHRLRRRLRRHPDPHRHRPPAGRPGRHLLRRRSTPKVWCCAWAGAGGSPPSAKPSPSSPATADAPSPAATTGPEWCERHHIVAWIDGGDTDLDNLTLLCRYHHHNFAARGWDCPHQRRRTPRMATTLVDRRPEHP